MSSAIERLAAQLTKLSNDEWGRLAERQIAGAIPNPIFGPAWEEISERLAPREWMPATEADDGYAESHDEEDRRAPA